MNEAMRNQVTFDKEQLKRAVKAHWEAEPCEFRAGKAAYDRLRLYDEIDNYRYSKSPFIPAFAKFEEGRDKRVLEVGLGCASDFIRWVRNGAAAWGRDLTEASVALACERLELEGLHADVRTGDVEQMEFEDECFDIVYSYGVIHHTPDTLKAVSEIHRVLKRGGTARIMIYNARGLSMKYEWVLFALLKGKPWRSIREIAFVYNESPGTKLYTRAQALRMFGAFRSVNIETVVDAGDTLDFELSERYRKLWLVRNAQKLSGILRRIRPVIPPRFGTTMLIEAVK